MSESKIHLGVVIVGHVDAGKSTTTGHLLFKLGTMDERTKAKLKAEAEVLGKGSFSFAFFLDKQKEERVRGVTISCTTKEFFTEKYHYTIIDAPGHRDFIKNMISGASQADIAVLMVPADGNFEASIAKGDHKTGEIQGQTRQHSRLINLLGIKQVIVGINKMDAKGYSEERYNEIKAEVTLMIKAAGYNPKNVPFIPMSGFNGENLCEPSTNMPWFGGWSAKVGDEKVTGITLLDALNNFVVAPVRATGGPVRMPVSGIFKINGIGDIVTGRIESGLLRPGDVALFTGSTATGKVFSIEMHHKNVLEAGPGDNVGVNVKFAKGSLLPKPGDCMYIVNDPKDTSETRPRKVLSYRAMVMIQDHPGQLKPGFSPSVHVRTGRAACRMTEIHWRKGKKTNKQKIENPPYVESGDMAEVTFEPQQSLYLEPYSRCEGLGRVAAMDSNSLIMLGRVNSVVYADE
jgi:elongation factor 1-alpha